MAKSIFTVLQDFEKLVYKILMWVILIPKTIVAVVLDPIWFREYVKGEEKDESPFDEYLSPVVLLLVVALLPALAFNFLPTYGTVISSPAETNPTTDRFLSFESQTDLKSSSTVDTQYIHTWTIEEVQPNGGYVEIFRERHLEGSESSYLEKVDKDTVKDRFLYSFDSGEYYINVTVDKIDSSRKDAGTIETYIFSLAVNVPVKSEEPVVISTADTKGITSKSSASAKENFSDSIKQEETIFLALALMIPPLLFALASRIFLDRKLIEQETASADGEAAKKDAGASTQKKEVTSNAEDETERSKYVSIGEETLKRSFYIQCYYFSPLSLAVWGTIYAMYFFTADVFLYRSTGAYWQIILLPLILCVSWFLRTEVKYFVLERQISIGKAAVISLICIAILGVGAQTIFTFADFQDRFRVWTIRAFPIASVLLIVAFAYAWFKRRRRHKEPIIGGNGAGLAAVVVLFLVVMLMIPTAVKIATPGSLGAVTSQPTSELVARATSATEIAATQNVESTPTLLVQQATPTVILETPSPTPSSYYTEDFNVEPASWSDFMTSGDSRMVKRSFEPGKLIIQLLKLDSRLARYYMINDVFTYSDVTVEAVVTNRGNNTNGVSLVCRYSDIGWYEFLISNSGFYEINVVDSAGIVKQGYTQLFKANSTAIKTGLSTNSYMITCKGNELSLFINQTLVKTIVDNIFQFAEGKIGIAMSSPAALPVKVEFETITVSAP